MDNLDFTSDESIAVQGGFDLFIAAVELKERIHKEVNGDLPLDKALDLVSQAAILDTLRDIETQLDSISRFDL